MSLRAFHVLFISGVGPSGAGLGRVVPSRPSRARRRGGVVVALALVAYETWFLRKTTEACHDGRLACSPARPASAPTSIPRSWTARSRGCGFCCRSRSASRARFAAFFIQLWRRAKRARTTRRSRPSGPISNGASDRAMNGPLGLPVAASAHAAEVDHTMVLVHILMAVLFVGWMRILPVRAVPLPPQEQSGRRLQGRDQPHVDAISRIGVAIVEVDACSSASRSRSGPSASTRSRGERRGRRARRRRAVRLEHPLPRPRREVPERPTSS